LFSWLRRFKVFCPAFHISFLTLLLIVLNVDGEEINYFDTPQITLELYVLKIPLIQYVRTFKTVTTNPITVEISTDTYDNIGVDSGEVWNNDR